MSDRSVEYPARGAPLLLSFEGRKGDAVLTIGAMNARAKVLHGALSNRSRPRRKGEGSARGATLGTRST